jgi:hypothetical protein
VLQPFGVAKDPSDFGISDQDACQGSELAYQGPEVTPLALVAHGSRQALRRLTATVHPKNAPGGADSRTRPPEPSHQGLPTGTRAGPGWAPAHGDIHGAHADVH